MKKGIKNINLFIESKINYQKCILNNYIQNIKIIKKQILWQIKRFWEKSAIKKISKIIMQDNLINYLKINKNKKINRFINFLNITYEKLFNHYLEKIIFKNKIKKNIEYFYSIIYFLKHSKIPIPIKKNILRYIEVNTKL